MHRPHRFFPGILVLLSALTALLATPFPARALTEAQQDAAIASLQSTIAAQQSTISALMAKLQYVTTTGTDMTISGANLHVVSGSGHTNGQPNGLGNVIIGYNESRGSSGTDTRTGSHNLILGTQNNYSSYSGIVAGVNNTVSSGYDTVTGGKNNTASGFYCTVNGGYGNTASGSYAAVGGGSGNAASGLYAFLPLDADVAAINTQITSIKNTNISQGSSLGSLQTNVNSLQTSVAGATAITNLFSLSNGVGTKTELTLTGVNLHIVNGLGATNGEPSAPYDTTNPVVNGLGNLILGYNATRANDTYPGTDAHTGSHNLILGDEANYSSYGGIVAGDYNTATGPFASAIGGQFNTAGGNYAAVVSGYSDSATGFCSAVLSGYNNTASGGDATVSGGSGGTASGSASSVNGGEGNTAASLNSSVSGGDGNEASGQVASVSGGQGNTASGDYSSVTGGDNNKATGYGSSVSGGASLTANGGYTYDTGNGVDDIWNGVGPTWAATTYSGH